MTGGELGTRRTRFGMCACGKWGAGMTRAGKPTVRSRYVAAHAHREGAGSSANGWATDGRPRNGHATDGAWDAQASDDASRDEDARGDRRYSAAGSASARGGSSSPLYGSRTRSSRLYDDADDARPRGARYDGGASAAGRPAQDPARPYARPAGGSFAPREDAASAGAAGVSGPVSDARFAGGRPAGKRFAPRGVAGLAARVGSAVSSARSGGSRSDVATGQAQVAGGSASSARLGGPVGASGHASGRHGAAGGSGLQAAAGSSHGRRITSLDGLRTLAILSVVAYHLGLAWLPSGHMGVVMFLVLSGYLVTCSVIRGYERACGRAAEAALVGGGRAGASAAGVSGGPGVATVGGAAGSPRFGAGLGSFWWRRFKRIWPPMAVMVVLVALLCIAFNHVLLTKMRPDIAPALLGFENIWYIVHGLSYFEQIGDPSPLTHLWYVGLDVQLCIVWPLLLSVLLHLRASRRAMRLACLGLALVSAVLMDVLFDPASDPSRVYYGPDTRAFAVLIGAWLALAWPLGQLPLLGRNIVARLGSHGVAAVGGVALLGLIAIMVFVPSSSAFFYYGGMVLVCLLSVLLMVALLSPANPLERLFSLPPLVWLGARSYALYLWHYPIIYLLGAEGHAPWWLKLLAVALSVGAAELSWLLVERPLSDGRVAAGAHQLAAWVRRGPLPAAGTLATTGVVALVSVGTLVGCLVVPDKVLVPKDALVSTGESVDRGVDLSAGRSDGADAGAGTDQGAPADAGAPVLNEPSPDAAAQVAADAAANLVLPEGYFSLQAGDAEQAAGLYDPMLIGDSVPGDTNFYDVFYGGYIDSYIGRHPFQAVSVLQDYIDQGVVGRVVVLATFSNSLASTEELDQLVAEAGPDRQVYLVGTVNPDGFQDEANAGLIDCAARYDNVHYVDWPAVCAGNEDVYLYPDGTHLTPDGAPVYLDMIARAIARDVVAAGGSVISWDDPAPAEDAPAPEDAPADGGEPASTDVPADGGEPAPAPEGVPADGGEPAPDAAPADTGEPVPGDVPVDDAPAA